VVPLETLKVGMLIGLDISRSADRGTMTATQNGAGTKQTATIIDKIVMDLQDSEHVVLVEVIVY
jgi:hypothetical protein